MEKQASNQDPMRVMAHPPELAGTRAPHGGSQSEGAGPSVLQGPDVSYQVHSHGPWSVGKELTTETPPRHSPARHSPAARVVRSHPAHPGAGPQSQGPCLPFKSPHLDGERIQTSKI
ncbi:hypothetical protein AB1E18_017089 [Capra hircus]